MTVTYIGYKLKQDITNEYKSLYRLDQQLSMQHVGKDVWQYYNCSLELDAIASLILKHS